MSDDRSVVLDGEKLRSSRERNGFSRETLSERTRGPNSVSVATIKRAEKGARVLLNSARALAQGLDTALEQLLKEAPLLPLQAYSDEGGHGGGPAGYRTIPAIAVLPFRDITESESALHPSVGDGLVEDLITRLGTCWFPVISRNSSLSPAGESTKFDLSTLEAKYYVEGTIQRAGERVRLIARLSNSETGVMLWSRSFDRALHDIFVAQDEIISAIVRHVDRAIVSIEYRKHSWVEPKNLDAWQLAIRGAWHFYHRTQQDNVQAREFLTRAVKVDSGLQKAWYALAMTHQHEVVNNWAASASGSLQALNSICSDFDRHHPDSALSHVAASYAAVYSGGREVAIARLSEAIEQDPNLVSARSLYGQCLAMAHAPHEGIKHLAVAMRLSPRDPDFNLLQLGTSLAHFAAGEYDVAASWAQKSIVAKPSAPFAYGTLAASLAQLGMIDEGKVALSKMIHLSPRTSAAGVNLVASSASPETRARYVSALQRVGLPK